MNEQNSLSKWMRFIFLITSCAFFLFLSGDNSPSKLDVGNFSVYNKDGEPLKLSSIQDKMLVIHFWSWG
ncbi:hypothetical protein L0Z72_07615 [candidate division KSB1 bacterium]|nr:hypothetical protein [candidate division KSB1 bacterium]